MAEVNHKQLLNFLGLCEEKSFSMAAKKLFISQQGLSKSIKQLEEDLEVPLFYRSPQGIELTEAAHILRLSVRSYLNQYDHVIETATQLKEKVVSNVSLGIPYGISNVFPVNFIRNFTIQNPLVRLSIRNYSDDTALSTMLENKLHLGFTCVPFDANQFDSVYHEQRKIKLLVSRNHPFVNRRSIKLHELKNENIISLDHNLYPQNSIREICEQNGATIDIFLNGGEKQLIGELCDTGHYVCLWADGIHCFPDLVFIDIEDMEFYWEYNLVVNKLAFISSAEEEFIKYTKIALGIRPSLPM
ncbi:LysR family transcriptional regulator [Treponema primitia]|uniref:LysR family transcriptional regulator n=1 Tax=Treponema primitia TaxID=88058 RepID=UPI0002555129|nr:LysR family transcriptional regulator [Treponema primitia]